MAASELNEGNDQSKNLFIQADDEGDIDADMLLGLLPDQMQARAESVMSKCTPAGM